MKLTTLNLAMGVLLAASSISGQEQQQDAAQSPAIVKTEFVADPLPTESCHASTLEQSEGVLMCAWFGGTQEGALDVAIWYSRQVEGQWTRAQQVANGMMENERIQYPCWNPVLFKPRKGPLLLFYKVGPSPSTWWGMVKTSEDNGVTWSKGIRLPDGYYGPIRAKPIDFEDGMILAGSSTEDNGWRVHMERTKNPTKVWWKTQPLNRAIDFSAIQPTIIKYADDRIQILTRTKQGRIAESWSSDRGYNWSRMRLTDLPNPSSGIDAVMLRDGTALLVYNHTDRGRGTLNVAVSKNGKDWLAALTLENTPGAEFSYPAVIQTADELVHVTYTWNRKKIKHVVIDPAKLTTQKIVDGQWPW